MTMKRAQQDLENDGRVSASEVMDRVASELHRLHAQLHQVETMVCAMTAEPGVKSCYLEGLQQFDVMLQTVSALAEFMQGMARETDGASSLPLARMAAAVKLGGMHSRLAGTDQPRYSDVLASHEDETGWHMPAMVPTGS